MNQSVTFKFHLPGPELPTLAAGALCTASAHRKEKSGEGMGKKSRNRSEIITVKTLLAPNKSHRPMSKQSTVICYPPHDTGSWTLTSGWSHTNEKSSEVLGGFGGLAQAKVTRCP